MAPPGRDDGITARNVALYRTRQRQAYRDRLLQADNLVSHNEASTGPEAGTQYRITLLQGDAVIRTVITEGTTWKWPDPDVVEGEKFNRVTLYSERDGLRSLQGYELQRL